MKVETVAARRIVLVLLAAVAAVAVVAVAAAEHEDARPPRTNLIVAHSLARPALAHPSTAHSNTLPCTYVRRTRVTSASPSSAAQAADVSTAKEREVRLAQLRSERAGFYQSLCRHPLLKKVAEELVVIAIAFVSSKQLRNKSISDSICQYFYYYNHFCRWWQVVVAGSRIRSSIQNLLYVLAAATAACRTS